MDHTLEVLALPGSLRERSFNRMLARAAQELAPTDVAITILELHDIPLYNQDLESDELRPDAVCVLKRRIDDADAVLFVTPEYNFGVPGVLKNAVDWASRPAFKSPMAGKPCGIMGAARGLGGTMRGQEQLKLNLLGMASQVFPHRGVAVSRAADRFDDDGRLHDEATRTFVADYLRDLAAWVRRVAPAPSPA